MKLDVFLEHPLIAPYKTEIYEALRKQADISLGCKWNPCLVNHPSRCSFKMLRTFASLTQTQASRRSRIPQPILSKIEAGLLLPTKRQFRALIEGYGAYGFEYAANFEKCTSSGELFYPPVFYLLAREDKTNGREPLSKIWDLTLMQWQNQVGVPMSFATAREVSGVRFSALTNMRRISPLTRKKIDNLDIEELNGLQIFQLAIIHRTSPLSLINMVLMKTLYKTNTMLGGKVELCRTTDEDGTPRIEYAPNEDFFDSIKSLVKELGLIPKWQHPLWDAYMLSLLAPETSIDEGLNKYYPFPLTPSNFLRYAEDPMLSMFAEDVTPPLDFAAFTDASLPHDELRPIRADDFYYYFINTPKSLEGWYKLLQD